MAYTASLSGTGANAFTILIDNTEELRATFASATAPTSPIEGQLWWDTSVDALKIRNSGAWEEVGTSISGDLNFNDNEMLSALLENVATDMTPSAATVGRIAFHTGADTIQFVADAATLQHVVAGIAGTDLVVKESSWSDWQEDDTTPPTKAKKGITRGWLFDALGELASTSFIVPRGYNLAQDLFLRVHYILNQAETDNDNVDINIDWTAYAKDSNELVTGAVSSIAHTQSIGTSSGNGAYNTADIPIDHDDATNPIFAGDLLTMEMSRVNLTDIGGIIVVRSQLLVPFTPGMNFMER